MRFILVIQFFILSGSLIAFPVEPKRVSELSKVVAIVDGVLTLDGQEKPQIFGAEVPYFRLRGGAGKNIPKNEIIDLWNTVLDRVVEAGMNAVSFAIPWDFHEYAEGKFDFDGLVDEDADGKPDYPARDIKTFFKLIALHNIKIVLIRPGPYIKAEWGFSGLGAVPLWFHEKYPESHMRGSTGLKNVLFDYHGENFQNHIRLWFQALYREVLFDKIGRGKPIKFVQLDSETNYLGQSIFELDYSVQSIVRYQSYLKDKYQTIDRVNSNQGSHCQDWVNIKPPTLVSDQREKLRDWHSYLDVAASIYLAKLRRIWERLGVDESQILFTSAEIYRASEFGILPNNLYRNNVAKTALMTVNLFQTNFDIKIARAASQNYLGYNNSWVMASGSSVSAMAAIFQGVKAFFVDDFIDGWPLQENWLLNEIQTIKGDFKFIDSPSDLETNLTEIQWQKVQTEFERRQFSGIDIRKIFVKIKKRLFSTSILKYSNGVLDDSGNPREQFQFLKIIGQKLVRSYGVALSVSKPIEDLVSIWRDSAAQLPSPIVEINNVALNSVWLSGLLAMLNQSKMQPSLEMSDKVDPFGRLLSGQTQMVFSIDGGSFDKTTGANVLNFLKRGGIWVNFLGVSLVRHLNLSTISTRLNILNKSISLNYVNVISQAIEVPVLSAPIYAYTKPDKCRDFLSWKGNVIAFICKIEGGTFIQMGALLFENFSTDFNGSESHIMGSRKLGAITQSEQSRIAWFEALLHEHHILPFIKWTSDVQAVSVVSHTWETDQKLGYWVFLQNREQKTAKVKLLFSQAAQLIKPGTFADYFQIVEVLVGASRNVTLKELTEIGLNIEIPGGGNQAVLITPILK